MSDAMEKNSAVNLEKLIEDFSQIEKKISDLNGKNRLLEIQLEKSTRLLKLNESKESGIREECGQLQKVIKGLQDSAVNQCSLRDENERLKYNSQILVEKLKSCEQEYKNRIDKLITEMKAKEEQHKLELTSIRRDMSNKLKLQDEEQKELLRKKETECAELTRQLSIQEKEKQSEIIKLQIEFNAKLARQQSKSAKSYSDTSVLPQNIFRMKLQHLQEEKNKEIETLRNTVKSLQQQLSIYQDPRQKRRRV